MYSVRTQETCRQERCTLRKGSYPGKRKLINKGGDLTFELVVSLNFEKTSDTIEVQDLFIDCVSSIGYVYLLTTTT